MLSRRLLRIKAVQSMYAALEREEASGNSFSAVKELTLSADSCYQLYIEFLDLLIKIRDFAEERIEIGKSKFHPTEAELNPNMRFVENPIFSKIEEALAGIDIKLPIDWTQHREIVADLYSNLLSSDFYGFYMGLETCSFAQHKKVIEEFLDKVMVENTHIENIVEEKSIFWIDDIEYAASFVFDGINRLSKDSAFKILDKYDDQEVEDFGKNLIRSSIREYEENLALIVQNTKNWDPERIALMDKVIMLVAIAEIKNFPTIPVKVSIDEYLEISKFYSSEDSSTFINGLLDKIVHDLSSEGLVEKSGRGLLQQ